MPSPLAPGTVMMMGDNPALPRLPGRPMLMDFFTLRCNDFTVQHLLAKANRALGHNASPTARMWHTMIWPNNFL